MKERLESLFLWIIILMGIAGLQFQPSYDPYHYYYKCTDESESIIPVIYVHNNVLKWSGTSYSYKGENDFYWIYDFGPSPLSSTFQIEKGTNRIKSPLPLGTWNCTLEKTLFKK